MKLFSVKLKQDETSNVWKLDIHNEFNNLKNKAQNFKKCRSKKTRGTCYDDFLERIARIRKLS